ncbi:hypothetical protein ACFQJD_15550 [Haloplanus sp. GCM10025708]|uniref:hypothetical protein n=1 Tax=Haloplanus sp. GCM10025708 TaxID=3252679 RepID=UPI003609653A
MSAGTTRNNQIVTATFDGVSADGNSDTVRMRFPDELASSLAVNSASQNRSGGLASSPNIVDGGDNDNVADTVEFQTNSGSGGGIVSMTTQVDVSVSYGSAGDYPVTATIVDSDRSTASGTAATISAQESSGSGGGGTVPIGGPADIESFDVHANSGDVRVSVTSSATLESLSVNVTDGPTLSRDDFTAQSADSGTEYVADISENTWGTYEATLLRRRPTTARTSPRARSTRSRSNSPPSRSSASSRRAVTSASSSGRSRRTSS